MSDRHLLESTAPATGETFDEVVLPHLNAAYRLARGLVGNEHDAEDVVQEASLRALRYFRTFTGGSGRAWFLRIVRNSCYDWRRDAVHFGTDPFDEESHSATQPACDPETLALHADDVILIERAMKDLPDRTRRLLVHREIDGLSYRELAAVTGLPIGTVMSGLSRARKRLRSAFAHQAETPRCLGTSASSKHRARRGSGTEVPRSTSTRCVANACSERRGCESCEK